MLCALLVVFALVRGSNDPIHVPSAPGNGLGEYSAPRPESKTSTRNWSHYQVKENGNSLSVSVLNGEQLMRVASIPLAAVPREWEVATRWLDRDMDGDGRPEFLVAYGNRLWEFKWLDSAFALVATPSLPTMSAWIEDLVFGDVNRDGVEELIIVAGAQKPESCCDVAGTLFVSEWSADSLRVLWTDDGRFGMSCASNVTPPDCLLGVYDIRNLGRPELLYQFTESSVWPCTYACYEWRDNALVESRSFRLDENSIFAESVPDSERFEFVMGISPFVQNGKTKLNTSSVDDKFFTRERPNWNQVLELHGDTIISARTISTTGNGH
jgi:hypothetical protein